MDKPPATRIYTVGHSNHSFDAFASLLRRHGVDAVADVRSAPYSRFVPHFSRAAFSARLEDRGLGYLFLGRELGGRSDDPAHYENGRIRYDRVAASARFGLGIERLLAAARGKRFTLTCAERDPLDCHRTLLVARTLADRNVDVVHIHPTGELEPQDAAMDRLVSTLGLDTGADLFRRAPTRGELIDEAVARQAAQVGYADPRMAGQPGPEEPDP